jgi:hypothetical protein
MYLATITLEPYARLVAEQPGPVAASWFSGMIRGWHDDRRETGYPPRAYFNDEIVLEIASGRGA